MAKKVRFDSLKIGDEFYVRGDVSFPPPYAVRKVCHCRKVSEASALHIDSFVFAVEGDHEVMIVELPKYEDWGESEVEALTRNIAKAKPLRFLRC